MTKSQIRKYAFIKSIPIMCSYIFVSMAYGIMMEDAGFKWYYSLLVSMTVYTGAFRKGIFPLGFRVEILSGLWFFFIRYLTIFMGYPH